MTNLELFFERMSKAPDKEKILPFVGDNILDLGAGNGAIEKIIFKNKKDVKITAVEKNSIYCNYLKDYFEDYIENKKLEVIQRDILTFVKFYSQWQKEKYDTIILSAVIHELDKEELDLLLANIKYFVKDGGAIIIRDFLRTGDETYLKIKVDNETNQKMISSYVDFHYLPVLQKNNYFYGYKYDLLNCLFAITYGAESFERREKYEQRFHWTLKELEEFLGNKDYLENYSVDSVVSYLEKISSDVNKLNPFFTHSLIVWHKKPGEDIPCSRIDIVDHIAANIKKVSFSEKESKKLSFIKK